MGGITITITDRGGDALMTLIDPLRVTSLEPHNRVVERLVEPWRKGFGLVSNVSSIMLSDMASLTAHDVTMVIDERSVMY